MRMEPGFSVALQLTGKNFSFHGPWSFLWIAAFFVVQLMRPITNSVTLMF